MNVPFEGLKEYGLNGVIIITLLGIIVWWVKARERNLTDSQNKFCEQVCKTIALGFENMSKTTNMLSDNIKDQSVDIQALTKELNILNTNIMFLLKDVKVK